LADALALIEKEPALEATLNANERKLLERVS
jgi:hypothetical protein